MKMGDDVVFQFTNGKTNRSTIHSDSRNGTDTVKIQKLILDYVEHEGRDLELCFEPLVNNFNNRLYLTTKAFYRAVISKFWAMITQHIFLGTMW
ncbi:MAG: hypothetical protein LJE96_16190 [Deltaproteobacteria bacterium]|nr:hypothetical protein [Deltaproteobacteria bacterium]